jgi:hypothetical protein
VGKRFNGSGTKGRPRTHLPAQAQSSYDPHLSNKDITQCTAYTTDQFVFTRQGCSRKHRRFLSSDRITRLDGHMQCKVCSGGGSSFERECYRLLDKMQEVVAFAVQACAMGGKIQYEGGVVHVGKHKWDVMLLQPGKVLIEVQGEQHSNKVDTRTNNQGRSLADQKQRDMALAQAAINVGYHVVWLHPGAMRGRTKRWRETIQGAVAGVQAGEPAQLHQG